MSMRRRGGARGARGPVGEDVGARARPPGVEDRRAPDGESRRDRAPRNVAQRQTDLRVASDRSAGGRRVLPVLRRLGPTRSTARRCRSKATSSPTRCASRRRRRRDRAVEFSAAADVVESGAGAGMRQHGDHQAREPDAADRARSRRDRARDRPSSRRAERHHRAGLAGRPDAGRPSGHRQDRVHRRHLDRQADHARIGRDAQAHHAGARRQVTQHRVSRRGPRCRGPRRDDRHLLRQR